MSKQAVNQLRLELRNTFPHTPRYDALRLAIVAVEGMEEADRNLEIVDKLKESYQEHIFKYQEERQGDCGNADAVWDKLLLLGGLLGKSIKTIKKDVEDKA